MMLEQVKQVLKAAHRHWLGRFAGTAFLPGWLLVLASMQHGSPELISALSPFVLGVINAGALLVVGLHLWIMSDQDRSQRLREFRVAEAPISSPLQKGLRFVGAAAFLAGAYQAVMDFDVFRPLLQSLARTTSLDLSSWEALLILCAFQFIVSLAEAFLPPRD